MGLIYSDIPELEGTDTETVLSNLRNLEKELGETFEKRMAHICELAHAIIKDGGDIDVVKSIILSIRSDGEISPISVLDDNEKELKMLFSGISVIERLLIFKAIFSERFSEDLRSYSSSPVAEKALGRIAYVKNSFNDAAFEQFSNLIEGAKAAYFDNLSDVCESVLSGYAQYCILPIETGKDGRLLSFYETITSNNLKINAEFDLKSSDGDTYTRYALVAASIQTRKTKSGQRFLEISYSDTDNLSIKDIISAAEFCGLNVCSIDTLFSGDEKNVNIVFESNGADIKTFATYLSVDCPDHTVMGYYQRF